MIAEMVTRVPGPKSKLIHEERIAWSGKFEGTNAWDVDGNRFLDLTSAGGALPFGYIDEDKKPISDCLPDCSNYRICAYDGDFLKQLNVIYVGQPIESAFEVIEAISPVTLENLAFIDGTDIDVLCLKSECLDDLTVEKVKSWCGQFKVELMIDEREIGFFRTGRAFAYLEVEPEYILTTVALGKFDKAELMYTRVDGDFRGMADLEIEGNYHDRDLSRTINLQSAEMSELLKDMVIGKEIYSVGSFHKIHLESREEAARVCHGLLQRGVIVSKLGESVAILPSLYLALGEILFAVNHIKAVVADINEMSLPWMTDEIR